MKRSKAFFGLTTTCLAIAGAVAAKVNHFTTTPAYVYIPAAMAGDHNDHCLSINTLCNYTTMGTPVTCKFKLTATTYSVYTTISGLSECSTKFVYTKVGEK